MWFEVEDDEGLSERGGIAGVVSKFDVDLIDRALVVRDGISALGWKGDEHDWREREFRPGFLFIEAEEDGRGLGSPPSDEVDGSEGECDGGGS